MDHHSMELLARERIQTFHREAAYRRPNRPSGPVARSLRAIVELLAALIARLGHRRTAEARVLGAEVMPDAS